MIRPLRSRHRGIFILLLLLLPLGLGAAILARKPPAPASELPRSLDSQVALPGYAIASESDDSWSGTVIHTHFLRNQEGGLAVELHPRAPLRQPALLLFWTSDTAEKPTRLPEDARLLGSFGGARGAFYPLPEAGGSLILYSLANQRVFSSASLPRVRSGEERE